MQMMKRVLLVVTAVMLVAGVNPAVAQQPGDAPQAQAPAPAPAIARGELVKVDTAAKMLVIRSEAGPQTFTYTDETTVTGANESIAGLATMSGSQVAVHFTKKAQTNVATRIEVQKKAS